MATDPQSSSNAAMLIRLNRDMFKTDLGSDVPELQRRLNEMLEELYDILVELAGNQLINNNAVLYADQTIADPNIPEEVVETGRTVTVNGLDDTGLAVSLKFVVGRLQE